MAKPRAPKAPRVRQVVLRGDEDARNSGAHPWRSRRLPIRPGGQSSSGFAVVPCPSRTSPAACRHAAGRLTASRRARAGRARQRAAAGHFRLYRLESQGLDAASARTSTTSGRQPSRSSRRPPNAAEEETMTQHTALAPVRKQSRWIATSRPPSVCSPRTSRRGGPWRATRSPARARARSSSNEPADACTSVLPTAGARLGGDPRLRTASSYRVGVEGELHRASDGGGGLASAPTGTALVRARAPRLGAVPERRRRRARVVQTPAGRGSSSVLRGLALSALRRRPGR